MRKSREEEKEKEKEKERRSQREKIVKSTYQQENKKRGGA